MRGSRFLRTALVALVSIVGLAACRVDTRVATVVNADGTGSVTVTVDADAEVVAAEPNLAKEFKVSDLVQAGWTIDGPTATADGGLTVVLTRLFKTIAEANDVLASISGPNGPLTEAMVSARGSKGEVHWSFVGSLDFSHGLEAAADQDLITTLGATPWLDQVSARQLTPTDVASLTFSLTLPGEPETVKSSSGKTTAAPASEWTVRPGDAALDLDVEHVQVSKSAVRARRVESQFTALLVVYLLLVVGAGALWLYSRSRRNRPAFAAEDEDEEQVYGPRSRAPRERARGDVRRGAPRQAQSRQPRSRQSEPRQHSNRAANAPQQPRRSRPGQLPPPRQRQTSRHERDER